MPPIAALALMVAGAAGWGGFLLAGLGLHRRLPSLELLPSALVLGSAFAGWLLFFPGLGGWLLPWVMTLIFAAGLPGLAFMRAGIFTFSRPRPVEWVLLAAVILLMAGDLAEGLSPPADADSMAYHFANAAMMVRDHHLVFIARAVDGAVPQLAHITYAAALGGGGERAMTLWVMVTGWASIWLSFAIAQRWLPRSWALGVALGLLGMPAVLYGAGTGQVEIRLAGLLLLVATAIPDARLYGWRFAVLAGTAMGFALGIKITALLFAAVGGVALLIGPKGLRNAAVFSVTALIAGGQWYGWTFAQSGDPFFPMLWGHLPSLKAGLWNEAQNAYFQSVFKSGESAVPRTPFWLLAYPVYSLFADVSQFDAGRVGLGPLPLFLLPYALVGVWLGRRRFLRSPLAIGTVIALAAYVLWFFLGPSQRVRHLLPLMPIIMVGMTVAARSVYLKWAELRLPLSTMLVVGFALQVGGAAVFSAKYVRHLASHESRSDFLAANVIGWEAVDWINRTLPDDALIATGVRQILYQLYPRTYLLQPVFQARVEVRPDNLDVGLFRRQLAEVGATYILTHSDDVLLLGLIVRGCASIEKSFTIHHVASRTLPGLVQAQSTLVLVRLAPGPCAA